MLKYEQLDADLFSWLRRQRRGITTANAVRALKVTNSTSKRHISRRFSQLEDRGTLVCEIQGTTRVCQVIGELPATLAKKKAANDPAEPVNQQIPASDSQEFIAAGGQIERLPSRWDNPITNAPKGSQPMGEGYALPFFGLDSID